MFQLLPTSQKDGPNESIVPSTSADADAAQQSGSESNAEPQTDGVTSGGPHHPVIHS